MRQCLLKMLSKKTPVSDMKKNTLARLEKSKKWAKCLFTSSTSDLSSEQVLDGTEVVGKGCSVAALEFLQLRQLEDRRQCRKFQACSKVLRFLRYSGHESFATVKSTLYKQADNPAVFIYEPSFSELNACYLKGFEKFCSKNIGMYLVLYYYRRSDIKDFNCTVEAIVVSNGILGVTELFN